MSAVPLIELTANLLDLVGADAGSESNPARLRIMLCGFGLTLPRIAGTAILAPVIYNATTTDQPIDISLWGNDQITPGGTYYSIEVIDGKGQTVQTAAYQFTGTQTIDLSNAAQLNPPPPTPAILSYMNLGGPLTAANVALGPSAGAGASFDVQGTDGNFQIRITAGTGATTGDVIFTVTFTTSRGHVTYPVVSPTLSGNQAPSTVVNWPGSSPSSTQMDLVNIGTALVHNTLYAWNVIAP